MGLLPEQKEKILECVWRFAPHAKVFIFGSRARGNHKRGSDLDMMVRGEKPLTDLQISDIKEALSVSDLPFLVDVQDYAQVDEEFLRNISSDLVCLN
jgi:type I restriction enzyme S subunit